MKFKYKTAYELSCKALQSSLLILILDLLHISSIIRVERVASNVLKTLLQ